MTVPPELIIPTRTALVEQHLKYQQVQYQELTGELLDVSEGGQPWIDANVAADMALSTIAQSRRITQSAFVETALDEDVEKWGRVYGVPKPEATGSLGLGRITASSGGVEIQQGEFLTIRGRSNGPRFQAQQNGRYYNNEAVPIISYDTGQETNLEPGTVLQWSNPPAGAGSFVAVVSQDGEGLTGGRDAATPPEHQAAILDKLRDPPGGANDAHYRTEARRQGIPVQQAFTYPAIMGGGTTGVTVTVFPQRRGGNRLPTGQQLRKVGAGLEWAFGATDSVLMTVLVAQPTTVAYQIDWINAGWGNSAPWPRFPGSAQFTVVVKAVTNALEFTLGVVGNDYTSVTDPAVGKRLAFFDAANSRFVEKRIGTVSGSGPWLVTADTTNRVSDESYTPVVGQRVSPWADSLAGVADGLIAVFDGLGPGELVGPVPIDGNRRLRTPSAPAQWPYRLTQELLEAAVSPERIPQVFDRALVVGDGATPAVGVPGVAANILTLGDLAVYPKS